MKTIKLILLLIINFIFSNSLKQTYQDTINNNLETLSEINELFKLLNKKLDLLYFNDNNNFTTQNDENYLNETLNILKENLFNQTQILQNEILQKNFTEQKNNTQKDNNKLKNKKEKKNVTNQEPIQQISQLINQQSNQNNISQNDIIQQAILQIPFQVDISNNSALQQALQKISHKNLNESVLNEEESPEHIQQIIQAQIIKQPKEEVLTEQQEIQQAIQEIAIKQQENKQQIKQDSQQQIIQNSQPQQQITQEPQSQITQNQEKYEQIPEPSIPQKILSKDKNQKENNLHKLHSNTKTFKSTKGHCSFTFGDSLYLIGGCDINGKCYNSIYTYNFTIDRWSLIIPIGEIPTIRQGHTCNLFGNKLILFGGNYNSDIKNDLFILNLRNFEWKKIILNDEELNKIGRTNHNSIIFNEYLYVFGGYNNNGYSNDFFKINLINFNITFIESLGNIPYERSNFIFDINKDNNKIYLFGGFKENENLNDFYEFNIEKNYWKNITNKINIKKKYDGISGIIFNNKMYFFGGCDLLKKKCNKKIFIYDLEKEKLLKKKNKKLSKRENYNINIYLNNLIIFGGSSFDMKYFNDIFMYETKENIQCEKGINKNNYCLCNKGYYNYNCNKKVFCEMNCNNNGICNNDGKCECNENFYGNLCQFKTQCKKNCTDINHGICNIKTGKCECKIGWMGTNCDIAVNIKKNLNMSEAESLLMKEINVEINNKNKLTFINEYFYLIISVFAIILILFILNYRKHNNEKNINKLNLNKSFIINNI